MPKEYSRKKRKKSQQPDFFESLVIGVGAVPVMLYNSIRKLVMGYQKRHRKSFNQRLNDALMVKRVNNLDEIKNRMIVSDEVYNILKTTSEVFRIKWQPTEDDKNLEATLLKFTNENDNALDLAYDCLSVTKEVRLPKSKFWRKVVEDFIKSQDDLKSMPFIVKIIYKLCPKENYIKQFVTSPEKLLEAYNKQLEMIENDRKG